MSEERELLSQVVDPRAGLFPAYEAGVSTLKEIVGQFVGDFSMVTDIAIEVLASSGFFKTLKEEAQIEAGDVQHIVGKFVNIDQITLTNKNILLLYKKGWRSRQSELIVILLKHTKEVLIAKGPKRMIKTKERRIKFEKEAVHVIFQVPQKERAVSYCFTLSLSVDNPWMWTKAIERVVGLVSPKFEGKERVCGMVRADVVDRGYTPGFLEGLYVHELCFTQKRMIFTPFIQGSLRRKRVGLALLMIPGVILLSFSIFTLFLANFGLLRGWSASRLLAEISFLIILIPGILLTFIPIFGRRFLRRRRFKRLFLSVPQNILDTNREVLKFLTVAFQMLR